MIGNAHIDPVWLWPSSEGYAVIHSTFRAALDRMREKSDFTFTASSAAFYDWVASNEPAMIAEIRKRIDEGRWCVVGGWWVEPDCNVPSGESFARHGLYGQRTFERLFGRRARVGYNPDSFGHAGSLPQILRLQGMDSYVFMRPMHQEKVLPADLFWWEGVDGSRVLTYRIPFSYVDRGGVEGRLRDMLAKLREPVRTLMAFYGAGDHGGGATRDNIASISGLSTQEGAPRVFFSTPERYFEEIRNAPALPVVRDDLQHHAVGCYSTLAGLKKLNRRSESWLQTAEKWAAVAAATGGPGYPGSELAVAWKKVLFQQFHDILAGTSLPEHYDEARNAYGYALDVAQTSMNQALLSIASGVPATDAESEYLVVFNPHSWPAGLPVEYDLDWPMRLRSGARAAETHSVLEDDAGKPVLHQWGHASTVTGSRTRLVFLADLPPFGYRQYRLRRSAAAPPPTAPAVSCTPQALENEHLRVTLDPDGSLHLFDKSAGREVLKPSGARAVVTDDPSDTWSHGVRDFAKEIGAFTGARTRVIERGPLRGVLRATMGFGASTLTQDWTLYRGAREVECRVRVDWREKLKLLKFSFPVDAPEPRVTYEIAYGHIERRGDGSENPGQRWVDVGGRGCGLALINDAKYGYSVLGGDLRVTVLRSPVYAHHDPRSLEQERDYLYQDQGEHEFRLRLLPHSGPWQDTDVVRRAEELNAPVPVIYQGIHPGNRPATASFLSVSAPNVVVTVLKRAEDGSDWILRAYETAGREATARIGLAFLGKSWEGRFRPHEIKTLRIPGKDSIREVSILEE